MRWQGRAATGSTAKKVGVHNKIHYEDAGTEKQLNVSRKSGRIQQWKHIVLDERARVTLSAGSLSKRLLEGRQRTNPAGEFNQGSPHCRGDMYVCQPGPSQYQQPAQHYEQHEGKVDDDDEIGHMSAGQRGSGLRES